MRKVFSGILAALLLLVLSINVLAVANTQWESLVWQGRVDAFEGVMDLSLLNINEGDIIGFDIFKGRERADLLYGVDGSRVEFASEMEINTDYSLRVLTNSKFYKINFKSSDLQDISETGQAMVVKVPAMPDKGFYWPYYLKIPSNNYKNENISDQRYLMIDTPNGGTRDLVSAEKWTRETLEGSGQPSTWVAEQLWTPMLMPAYPNPNANYFIDGIQYMTYEHALDREIATLHLKLQKVKTANIVNDAYRKKNLDAGDFANLDKQLIAMFEHAVEYLNKYNHNVATDKMFLSGYSATGSFTDRFTAMHPEKVKAVASGGTLDKMVVPLKKHKGEKLIFPVGIYDYKEITGKEFDLKKHGEVARLIYRGDQDNNNTAEFGYLDCHGEDERQMIVRLWGLETTPRARALRNLYGQSGGKGILILDKGIEHSTSRDMEEYLIDFFKANRNSNEPVYPIPSNPQQLDYKIFK